MEQPEEIDINQDEKEIEAVDLETKQRKNTNTRPRRANTGKGVEHCEMKFGGGKYDTQFATSTGQKKTYFMHDIHKISVDVKLTQMTAKKGIKNHGGRAVEAIHNKNKQLE